MDDIYRVFAWDSNDNLESLGDYYDADDEVGIGAELALEGGIQVEVLEILEPNPKRIKLDDGTIYEPSPIIIVSVK